MRLYIIIISLLSAVNSFAQNAGSMDLERRIDALESRNKLISKRLSELEMENFNLNQKLTSLETNTQAQIVRSQELQAQNERAVNIALDGFSNKFQEQNKTVENVKNQLDKVFVSQTVMFVLTALILVVIFIAMSRKATRKAIESNVATWNQFQEHLLKK
jgi:predicted RNase H-like nuclease (RuvC/YqgF family)